MPAKLASAALLTVLLAAAPGAEARPRAPHVSWVKCMSSCTDKRTVAPGGTVKIAGTALPRTGRVMFPVRLSDGSAKMRSMKPRSATSSRLLVAVPANARSGRLYVRASNGVRTNSSPVLKIRKLPATTTPPPGGTQPPPSGTAFDGSGMWIWYVNKANGGDPNAIVAQAKAHGVSTVFVKAGDGGSYWSQFSPALVGALRAGGLRVCAWQYVYGTNPTAEAAVAVRAVKEGGPDCFVIDAESEYEGRYSQAQTYVSKIRAGIGPDYPLGLAGFPYVDYHPSFPYSVFFAPNGAQFNVPQTYWQEIGGGVDAVVAHMYRFNRPYGRTIAPLGQTYNSPPSSDIVRFRQLAAAGGATGLSWWSWQHTAAAGWNAIGQPISALASAPARDFAVLAKGAKGDLVLWAQLHLKGAGQAVATDGTFGATTDTAVRNFQTGAGLAATGKIDAATWQALLQHAPAKAKWSAARSAPKTAKLPARRYEIGPSSGARSGSGWHATG
jgi:hypothetical protein